MVTKDSDFIFQFINVILFSVCYQLGVSATGWSSVQRIPAECGVSECDLETSTTRRPEHELGCCSTGKETCLWPHFCPRIINFGMCLVLKNCCITRRSYITVHPFCNWCSPFAHVISLPWELHNVFPVLSEFSFPLYVHLIFSFIKHRGQESADSGHEYEPTVEWSDVKLYLLAAGDTKHLGLTTLSMAEQAYTSVCGGSYTDVTGESNHVFCVD